LNNNFVSVAMKQDAEEMFNKLNKEQKQLLA